VEGRLASDVVGCRRMIVIVDVMVVIVAVDMVVVVFSTVIRFRVRVSESVFDLDDRHQDGGDLPSSEDSIGGDMDGGRV
jgi:hypothetical protein